jgi:hypothetical protein
MPDDWEIVERIVATGHEGDGFCAAPVAHVGSLSGHSMTETRLPIATGLSVRRDCVMSGKCRRLAGETDDARAAGHLAHHPAAVDDETCPVRHATVIDR